jgi:aminoglycoside N3'-acetyltransferase
MEKLVKLDGKMVLIGCVDSSPGFSTVHLAQEKLGLAKRSLLRGLLGTYFEKNGKLLLFKLKDFPGCSMGFSRFYADYIKNEKLRVSYVGRAYSILIGARDAFAIEYKILKDKPKYALCDNPGCFVCRGTRLYNKSGMIQYYLVQGPRKFFQKAKIGRE